MFSVRCQLLLFYCALSAALLLAIKSLAILHAKIIFKFHWNFFEKFIDLGTDILKVVSFLIFGYNWSKKTLLAEH